MKALLNIFFIVLSINILSAQETKTVKGRIISEDLEPIPKEIIYNKDTVALGSTEVDGYFRIDIPVETKELLLGFVAMEWTSVKIGDSCQNLEMIMDVIYDFVPIRKINNRRYKRFRKLPKKHLQAYEQGIFKYSTPCVSYTFTEY